MYIIMCEVRKYINPTPDLTPKAKTGELISAHPIRALDTKKEAEQWFVTEPNEIVKYLNEIMDEKWELGKKQTKFCCQIWNTNHTIERMYVSKKINIPQKSNK